MSYSMFTAAVSGTVMRTEYDMFHKMINAVAGFGANRLRTVILAGAALAGIASVPTSALARHPDFRLDVVVPAPPICVEPIGHAQRRWVEPVYQTITDQVWVPAATQTQIQRVVIPAQYEWRDIATRDFFGRLRISRQQVLINPAHVEDRPVNVVVCPSHYEQQTHEQVVCAGYWADEAPVAVVRPRLRFALPLPF